MATWLQFSFWDGASNSWSCKLDSVSRLSVPRRACLEAICLWRPLGTVTTIGTDIFSWGTCNQVTVLACACERRSEQFEQGKTFHMGYLIGDIERRSKALLANRQLSFLKCFASCSDGVKDPSPAGAVQFETMSTWLQFSFWDGASNSSTRKLDSVSRMNIFAKKGLPRSHLLWLPLGTFFTTIGTEVFSWGTCNQVTVLACACERQSEHLNKERHATWTI